jgi:hypothetical protein
MSINSYECIITKREKKRDGCSDGYFIRRYARDAEKCRKAGAQRRVKTKKQMKRSHFVLAWGEFPAGMRVSTAGEKITNETR